MKITITGASRTPNWNTIQDVLRETTGHEKGMLTRIARKDNGVDYTAPGAFDLAFATFDGACSKPVELTVTQ